MLDTTAITENDITIDDGSIESLENIDFGFEEKLSIKEADSKAQLAAIASKRILGVDSQEAYNSLLVRYQEGQDEEIKKELAIGKIQSNIDDLIVSETKNPTMSTQDFMGLMEQTQSQEQKDLLKKYYGSIIEKEAADELNEGALTDSVRSVVIDKEELGPAEAALDSEVEWTPEKLKSLQSWDRRNDLTSGLIKLDQMRIKYGKKFTDLGISEKTVQVLTLFMIGIDTYQQYMTGKRGVETLGDAYRKEIESIFNTGDMVGQLTALEDRIDSGNINDLLKLDAIIARTESDGWQTARSIFETIDVLGIFGAAIRTVKVLGTARHLSAYARQAENPQAVVNRTEELANAATESRLTNAETDELVENITPTITNGEDFVNNVSARAARLLERQEAELAAIKIAKGQKYLSDEEQKIAIASITDEILTALPRVTATDVRHIDNTTGVVTFRLGTGDDGLASFNSAEAAHNAAKRLGIKDEFYKVTRENGLYHLEVERDLSPLTVDGDSILKGFDTPKSKQFLPLFLTRWITGNKVVLNFADRLVEGGVQGGNIAAKLNEIFRNSTKLITKLNRKQRKNFDAVMRYTQMNNEGRWLTMEQFRDFYLNTLHRAPSVNEEVAYGAAINIHKADEFILNSNIRLDMVQRGFQEIGIKGLHEEKTIGKVLRIFDRQRTKNVNIFDATNGKYYPKNVAFEDLSIKLAANPNLVLVKYIDDIKVNVGKGSPESVDFSALSKDKILNYSETARDIQYVLTTKQHVNQTAIRPKILNHFDGPHRQYKNPIFIKQGVLTGGEVTKLKTQFNVGSEHEAIKIADEYNEALSSFLIAERAVKENASNSATAVNKASEVIQKNTRFSSYDEFKQAIDADIIRRTPFEAWADGGTMPLNNLGKSKLSRPDLDDLDLDPDLIKFSEETRKYMDQGRMYYSSRSTHLKNPEGQLAPILDHVDILEKSIQHIIHTRSFGEYKARHMKEWVETYGQYLDTSKNRPDWYTFNYAQFKPDTPTHIYKTGERVRLGLNRIIGATSKESKRSERLKYDLAQYVFNPDATTAKKLSYRGMLKLKDLDPVSNLRSFTFKLFLGMADAAQILIQTSLVPALALGQSIGIGKGSRHGLQALAMLPAIRMATLGHGNKFMDHIASIISTSGLAVGKRPLKSKEIRWMLEDLKNSGVDVIRGSQAELLNPFDGNIIGNNRLLKYGDKALDIGLIPFREGERLNQTFAFTLAWLEHFGKYRKRPTGDQLGRVLNRAETFAGNMKAVSRSGYQSGITSLPAQFAAHPHRVMEQMLEQSGGLTKSERIKYYTSIAVLYGLGGLGIDILTDKISERYAEATDQDLSPELTEAVSRGIVGTLFPGTDISRMQPLQNNLLFNVVKNLISDSHKSFQGMWGPSISLVGDFQETIGGSILARSLLEGNITLKEVPLHSAELVKNLLLDIPLPSRLEKAWMMYKYGIYKTKSGKQYARSFDLAEVALTAAGLPPMDSKDVRDMMLNVKEQKAGVMKDAKRVLNLYEELLMTDDTDRKDFLSSSVALWIKKYEYIGKDDPLLGREFKKQLYEGLGKMTSFKHLKKYQELYKYYGSKHINQRIRIGE